MRYDALARVGQRDARTVHSQYKDLAPVAILENDPDLIRPDQDEVQKTTDETKAALERLVSTKIKSAQVGQAGAQNGPTYVRYTPAPAPGSAAEPKTRIIKMVEAPTDPLEPPKFRHKRLPGAPPSPPPPVMHSPPRKLSAKEQQEWKIPPSVSNWKNPRGHVIPLDKRLAADGRGLQEVTINENFGRLSEALLVAERQAREEVEKRNAIQRKIAEKEKDAKEDQLRRIAQQAREGTYVNTAGRGHGMSSGEEDEETVKRQERDAIRRDRLYDIERDTRMARMAPDRRAKVMARDLERDVSEQIALGLAKPTASKETVFDQRLFNQSQVAANLGDEEAYNVYDKPLFSGGGSGNIYRPKRQADDDAYGGQDLDKIINTERFQADRGFQGADAREGPRPEGPVEFEKVATSQVADDADDPFAKMDQFFTDAKKGKRGGLEAGSRAGHMHASAGGGSFEASGRSKIQFESSSNSANGRSHGSANDSKRSRH